MAQSRPFEKMQSRNAVPPLTAKRTERDLAPGWSILGFRGTLQDLYLLQCVVLLVIG